MGELQYVYHTELVTCKDQAHNMNLYIPQLLIYMSQYNRPFPQVE